MTPDQQTALVELLDAASEAELYSKLQFFEPYPRQLEFFGYGKTHRERCLMAPNRVGKSQGGAYEVALHLTGDYPDAWPGRRWDRATRGWAAGLTTTVTRDIIQKALCGTPGVTEGPTGFGTGFIPKDRFADAPSTLRGVADAFDTIQVKHKSGGISTLNFKSFEQGREKFQGDALDFGWADEEGDEAVYMEFLTRMTATTQNPDGGILFTTYTPLKGETVLTNRFTKEHSPDRKTVHMALEDAHHISKAEREQLERNCPAHEKDARIFGRPGVGGGAVFPYLSEMYTEPAIIDIPRHWRKLWGIDFGIDHPFGAVLILYDPDNDVVHVHSAIRMEGLQGPIIMQHANAIKRVAAAVPVAWPHDGAKRDSKSGEPMSKMYRAEGLKMLGEHATWPTGGYSFEAGITEMQTRFTSGRLKIAAHLSELLAELRGYRREDGQVVKKADDLISALRIAIMMKRSAAAVPLGDKLVRRRPGGDIVDGVDFDPFTGR